MTQVNTSNTVRVRFAPSPTGHLHIGGLRTALFNWLFARHNRGAFLLRIEDTDLERSKAEYTASILETFSWAELTSDEPIVIQSMRKERHKEIIHNLLTAGKAYRCYCTPHELEQRIGTSAAQEGGYAQYDKYCCDVTKLPENYRNRPYAVRFKIPDNIQVIRFHDLVHGELSFNRDQFDDFVIMRSDGSPMYNFVVVVDDADMGITHVIRGEEHISNTPKQIMLYQACNFTMPKFGHLPMILGPSGAKLSKRDAATAVLDYKKQGFLADALCNYLVRLGWSHGDQEIFSRAELINYFSLEHVGKKGAIFDSKKLEWVNNVYIKERSAHDLLALIARDVDHTVREKFAHWSEEKIERAIDLYKDRVKTGKELMSSLEEIYNRPINFNTVEIAPWRTEATVHYLEELKKSLQEQKDFSAQSLADLIKSKAYQLGIKLPDIAKPLRIALTGKSESPSIFELLALLEKNESITRLEYFLNTIKA